MLPYGKNTDKKYLFIKVNISPPTNKVEGNGACLPQIDLHKATNQTIDLLRF